jgi:hypothetical protein
MVNYKKLKALLKIFKMLHGTFDLFLSPCSKSRLSEAICSLLRIEKFGHILPVFCPYLEFFSSLLWQLTASLKYLRDR